ncbi:MAG TPA: AsmA-like C-terminal region-containing protein, partial [Pseudomonadota bacterium]|nr:AsmA-like C-terminal region-containing protein [Pseudomonadota bacterium]
ARWPKILGLAVGGTLLLFFVVVLIVGFAVDLGQVVRKQIVAQLPEVQKKIGREVSVGTVSLRLLPKLRLRVRDVKVSGQPGQTGILGEPLAEIGSIEADVSIVPAILTMGRRINVSRVEIANGKVQVARLSGGRLSYEDVLDHLATQPKDDTPLTQAQIEKLAGITIERAELTQSAVLFHDLSTGKAAPPLKIDGIHLQITDGKLFGETQLSLDMALLQLVPNFHLGMVVGPLPKDLRPDPAWTVLRKLELKLQSFQIEPLLAFLPASTGTTIERAMVEADLLIKSPPDSGKLSVAGKAGLRGLQLRQNGVPAKLYSLSKGAPTDVMLSMNVDLAMLAGDIRVEKARLDIADMNVTAEADLRNLWKSPAVHSLQVASHGLKLERLLALLPKTAVPTGTELSGPLSVSGSASGTPTAAAVKVSLDMTESNIATPQLRKPTGMPLTLGLLGTVKDPGFRVDRFGLVLGPLSLLLHGELKSGNDFDLTLDSGTVDLDKLLRLLPMVADGSAASGKKKKKGPTIDGDLRVSGGLTKKGDQFSAHAKVKMQNADFEQDGMDLSGTAELSAEVKQSPSNSSVDANLDLTPAALHVSGSVDKDRGVPMRISLSAQKTPTAVQIKQAQLELPGGLIKLVGSADLAKKYLDMKVPLVDLDLAKLAQVVPQLRQGAAGGLLDSKLTFGLSLSGNPEQLSSVRAKLDQFKMQVAGGTILGGASVQGLDEPKQASFDFSADYLDLDKILGEKKGGDDDEDAAPSKEVQVPKVLKHLEAEGKIKVASGKLKGQTMRDFVLEMTLSGGKLILKVMRMQAVGGSILLSGTSFDFAPSKPKFAIKAKLDKVDLHEIISFKSNDLAKKLQGHGSMDLSADGQGLRWEDIAPRLLGQLDLGFTEGKLVTAKLGSQVVGPLMQRLGLSGQSGDEREMSMKNLTAQFKISDGRLRTNNPIRYQTEQGAIQLTGSIGLDKTLDLLGDLQLQPAVISALTAGKVVPAAPGSVA